jgi:DNA-binding response OmpR family regulator
LVGDDPANDNGAKMSPARKRKRVLILEDDDDVSALLSIALEEAGYETVVHRDAAEVDPGLTSPPSAIILDLVMPGARMDGLTFLIGLAEQRAARQVPVIILSGLGDVLGKAVNRSMAEHLTIAAVFPKPFSIDEVLAKVSEITRSAA